MFCNRYFRAVETQFIIVYFEQFVLEVILLLLHAFIDLSFLSLMKSSIIIITLSKQVNSPKNYKVLAVPLLITEK